MKKLITPMLLLILILSGCGSSGKKEDPYILDMDALLENSAPKDVDITGLKLQFGTLLEIKYPGDNEKKVVVKAKITPNLTNDMTVKQNFMNVTQLIQNNGFDVCEEISYWAVADMSDGSESKVVSFTVNGSTISGLKNNSIQATDLADYADDLYIHPSLR